MSFTKIKGIMGIVPSLNGNCLEHIWTSWHAPLSPKGNPKIFTLAPKVLAIFDVKQCVDIIN